MTWQGKETQASVPVELDVTDGEAVLSGQGAMNWVTLRGCSVQDLDSGEYHHKRTVSFDMATAERIARVWLDASDGSLPRHQREGETA